MPEKRTFKGSAPRSIPDVRTLRGAALALLSRRDYTTLELRNNLSDRGYSADDIDQLISGLTASGVLNDQRVAAAHVRTASRVKSRGRLRIARELSARGLSRAIIDEALAAVEKPDELAAIRKILDRKRWPAKPTIADRRRMYQHLLRRGFPSDAIQKALGRGRFDEDWEVWPRKL